MDGASLVRLRWRLRGASMWPTFIVLTLADGVAIHLLPVSGDRESLASGWLLGGVLGLFAIAFAAPVLGFALRRIRRDLPKVVAFDTAGTAAVMAITAGLLAVGILHHGTVVADRHALQDAVARAEAYIGARAPQPFRDNLQSMTTYELQPPRIYRSCVTNRVHTADWCVVVDRNRPFGSSVRRDGAEPNQVLSQGTG